MQRVGQKGEDGDRGGAGPSGFQGTDGSPGFTGPKGVMGQKGNPVSIRRIIQRDRLSRPALKGGRPKTLRPDTQRKEVSCGRDFFCWLVETVVKILQNNRLKSGGGSRPVNEPNQQNLESFQVYYSNKNV